LDVDVGGMVPKFMVDPLHRKSFDETGKALTAYAKKIPVQTRRQPVVRCRGEAPRAKQGSADRQNRRGYNVWLLGEAFGGETLAARSAKRHYATSALRPA